MSTPIANNDGTDTLYIIDFDRTLADSDKLLQVFIEITNHYITLPLAQIEKIDADIKAKGDSFDTAMFVRDALAAQARVGEWDKLQQQFIHESRSLNMLLPGASELLSFMWERRKRYGILTYGNPLWQHLKLSASGFNRVNRIVTTNKHKGVLIASWQQDDGRFVLPSEFGGGVVDTIVLIDDKAASFEGFPSEPSLGYQVLDYATALPAQLGNVPRNVTHVSSLQEVIALL
ncbi:MAG: hypothetical protein WAS27_02430 [Candidatus Saccharimonadales bacterium]